MKRITRGKSTPFSIEIKKSLGIHEVQGICRDRTGTFTAVVEAIDMECELKDRENPDCDMGKIITPEEIYAKAVFAERLGVCLSLVLHYTESGEDRVVLREYMPDHVEIKPECRSEQILSGKEFADWWKEKSYGKHRMAYREDVSGRAEESWFDRELEKNDSTWTNGVDGFVTKTDDTGDLSVLSVVVNRISNMCKIKSYDPNRYFDRDYKEWVGLMKVSEKVGVPIALCTYSRLKKDDHKLGMALVESVSAEGLTYRNGKKPTQSIMESAGEVENFLKVNI